MRRYKGNSTFSQNGNDRNTLLYLIIALLLIFILFIIPFYHWRKPSNQTTPVDTPPTILNNVNIASRNERLDDPYYPPVYTYPFLGSNTSGGTYLVNGQQGGSQTAAIAAAVPINIKTQGRPTGYEQIGILTASSGNSTSADGTLILPLMGRLTMRNRQKWQYYTMANGVGSINTKLPVYSGKRACMSENGCDEIMSGDTLFVQGYNQPFIATIYENQTLEYLPVVI